MTIKNVSTIKPGYLVSLKSSSTGGVTYETRDLQAESKTESGAVKAKWETERTIIDPAEHEAAQRARSKARSLVTAVCVHSSFGLLCEEAKADDLEKAIKEARAVADAFNATARVSRVSVNVLIGRIAADDVEAMKAINSEVSDLLQTMERGLANLDVKVVRDAAQRAKNVGNMLSPEAQAKVTIAVEAARKAARKIVDAGEAGAAEIDRATIQKVEEMRTAFLDLDGGTEIQAPVAEARALDLAPAEEVMSFAPADEVAPIIDLGGIG